MKEKMKKTTDLFIKLKSLVKKIKVKKIKEKYKVLKKKRWFSLVQIIIFIALCITIGCSAAYINHESDPTDRAVEYFKYFVQKNYEKMYDFVDQSEGTYVDKSLYMEKIKKIRNSIEIDTYEIMEPKSVDGIKVVTIKYTDINKEGEQKFDIPMKPIRNGIQIIPDYNVDISNMLTKDITIKVPSDMALQLNGTTLDKKKQVVETDNNVDTYKFSQMLAGTYKATALGDCYCYEIENAKIKKEGKVIDLTSTSFTANEEYREKLKNKGDKFIDQFYKAARVRKNKLDNIDKITKDKALKKTIKKSLDKTIGLIFPEDVKNIDKYIVTDFQIGELKPQTAYDKKNKIFTVSYEYEYYYIATTEISLMNSYTESIDATYKTNLKLKYSNNNGKLSLVGVELKNKKVKEN